MAKALCDRVSRLKPIVVARYSLYGYKFIMLYHYKCFVQSLDE